jgi:TRAP-type C4-dicarboxylate transport system permease small subunit
MLCVCFYKIIRGINIVSMIIAIGCMIASMLLIVATIVVRLLGSSVQGTYELTQFFILVVIAYALVLTTLKKGHVIVDMVVSRLSQLRRGILVSFTLFLGIGFWAMTLWASVESVVESALLEEKTFVLGIPFLPFRCILVLALFAICSVLLIDLIKTLRQLDKR